MSDHHDRYRGMEELHGTNLAEVGTDCISRQAAIEVVQNRHMMLSKEKVLLINDLEKLPPAEPKRGRWINGHCSECNEHAPYWCMASTYHASNFCPNCGMDMRGEQE